MRDGALLAKRLNGTVVGLRKDLEVSRHIVSGRPSYVFHDPVAFKNHAFGRHEYEVMTAISAQRSLGEVFADLVTRGVLASEEEEDFYSFVVVLHGYGMLRLPVSEAGKLFERFQRKQQGKRKALWMAPMYLRVPLWDPDGFLNRTARFVRPLFSLPGLAAWLVLWAVVGWNLLGRGAQLVAETADMLTFTNLPMIYVVIVLLKAVHEFGHAYCSKRFGCEVPEIGVAFIVATPCAYVDASASWKLPSRWQRIAIGLAGMYVELIVAAVAALVWVATPPGFAHSVALSVLVMASVTTLLFNINPLMRFDGYYVFADLIGVPNLRDRSTHYVRDAIRSVVVGVGTFPRTRIWPWLLSYGVASVAYRILLAFSICALMLAVWPTTGLVLCAFFAFLMIVQPTWRALVWLWTSEDTQPVRVRARAVAGLLLALAPTALSWLPVSTNVVADGVLEREHLELLRAPADGFVAEVRCNVGDRLEPDQQVVVLENRALDLEVQLLREQLLAEELQVDAYRALDPLRARYHDAGAAFLRDRLASLEQRRERLCVRTESGGAVADRRARELQGAFVRAGDPLVEVRHGARQVRALLLSEDRARALCQVGRVATLRWALAPDRTVRARVVRVEPAASRSLVPAALTRTAGGNIFMLDGQDGPRADRSYLHVVLQPEWVPEGVDAQVTASVLFDAEVRTLGQWVKKRVFELYSSWRMS